jgi:hypothetical protein
MTDDRSPADDRGDLRARRLLRLGSDPGAAPATDVAAAGLRPGFMERLRARIAADARAASPVASRPASPASAGAGPAGWPDALGALARPALALGGAAAVLAGAVLLLSPAAPAGAGGDTLAALVEEDPDLFALLGGEWGGLWPGNGASGGGRDDGGDGR